MELYLYLAAIHSWFPAPRYCMTVTEINGKSLAANMNQGSGIICNHPDSQTQDKKN
ncbi:MAG: hypothetical protein WCD53_17215 [Microcoleus sp.]